MDLSTITDTVTKVYLSKTSDLVDAGLVSVGSLFWVGKEVLRTDKKWHSYLGKGLIAIAAGSNIIVKPIVREFTKK